MVSCCGLGLHRLTLSHLSDGGSCLASQDFDFCLESSNTVFFFADQASVLGTFFEELCRVVDREDLFRVNGNFTAFAVFYLEAFPVGDSGVQATWESAGGYVGAYGGNAHLLGSRGGWVFGADGELVYAPTRN